mmetsp:Transcript_20178/g.28383  ORF Transcript_20178/g.28383 Transcript_20178/m.28383 type:complete len:266 (+) Transcript_20178:97-894(+)
MSPKTRRSSKPLSHIESEAKIGVKTRYHLKRLSRDNIRDMGRQISKVSHNNPLVVFSAIPNQIESYDNLILMMVDSFKFVTVLGLDVLGYCLVISLGGGSKSFQDEGRSKLKEDGINSAQWLSSLETFTGAFYRKFPDVEIRGLLSYIAGRLANGHVLELGVLQSLLKTAGGYGFAAPELFASLSREQLEGKCGSILLNRETSDFGVVEKVNLKSFCRLHSILLDDETRYGVIFLVLLSQARISAMYHIKTSSSSVGKIKLIGNL